MLQWCGRYDPPSPAVAAARPVFLVARAVHGSPERVRAEPDQAVPAKLEIESKS